MGRWSHLVPGLGVGWDVVRNASWRREVLARGDLWPAWREMCREDVVFWLGAFGWLFEPRRRRGEMREVPFVPWGFQVDLLERMKAALNDHDVLVAKTRDMGVSWLAVMLFLHQWLFEPGTLLLMVSRNETYVDMRGNPKSLFWKLDYGLERLPSWMVPPFRRKRMQLRNLENGSVIDGESTTGDVARGDRRVAILLDEFAAVEPQKQVSVLASTSQSTNCRLIVSTFGEEQDAFERKSRDGSCEVHKVGWWLHPEKSDGMIERADGTRSSPWYERECARIGDQRQVARELDCDPQSSGSRFFEASMIRRVTAEHGVPPLEVGSLVHDKVTGEPIRFDAHRGGRLSLWFPRNAAGVVALPGRVGVGVDVSEGTGASPSVVSVIDGSTGRKVLEYADATIRPEALAVWLVALMRWLGRAHDSWVCPEAPGPGRTLMMRLQEMGFTRLWRDPGAKLPGFTPSKETRRAIYTDLLRAVASGAFRNHSLDALAEYGEVVYRPDGWIVHRASTGLVDPSGARASHADRVTADALAWMVVERTRGYAPEATKPHPESFAHRYALRDRARKLQASGERRLVDDRDDEAA